MDGATYRFRALALLLSYPEPEWLPELEAVLEPLRRTAGRCAGELRELERFLQTHSVEELQEYYVSLFDRTRSLSLHLMEHSHGDARERGAAMARLVDVYAAEGWSLATRELPDYLPAFLEFLALVDAARRGELLAEAREVIVQLSARLREKHSPYAVVLSLIEQECAGNAWELHGKPESLGEQVVPGERTAPDGPWLGAMGSADLKALDAEWEEQPVSFSPGAAHDSVAGFVPLGRIARGPSAKDQLT